MGDYFFKFAIQLNQHTDPNANEADRLDKQQLHMKREQAIQGLTLNRTASELNSNAKIHLPSTGKYLSDDEFTALERWKINAYHDVKVNNSY